MKPCPCGYLGDESGRCNCPPDVVTRYRQKISGPLLDRIDLHVDVPPMGAAELRQTQVGESTAAVAERVGRSRAIQLERANKCNAALGHADRDRHCALRDEDAMFLEHVAERLGLSARAYHRILKVARTIADLAGEEQIQRTHLTEAVSYRVLDRSAT